MVSPAPNTLQAVKNTVRRITASPDPSQLSESDLEEYINGFYVQELPASIKTDQLRTVLEIFTTPNIDTYAVDVNTYQELQDPILVNGRIGNLFKDRSSFYSRWNRQSVLQTPAVGDGTTGPYSFTLSSVPILPNTLVIGSTDTAGNAIKIEDDGEGNLVDAGTTASIGSINYATGAVSVTTSVAVASGSSINVWGYWYQPGYPIDVLYWNNEITVRPVPNDVYRIEITAILTPTAFAANSSTPVVDQWWQYVALGAAVKIMRDRQDMDGVANITPLMEEQRGLILERQANEEIGQRNSTIYSGEASMYNRGPYWT